MRKEGEKLSGVLAPLASTTQLVTLLAVTLEKSPIRSLGSLSKMFSMVPLREDVRDRDWCRSCKKPKVENETRVLTKTPKTIYLYHAKKGKLKYECL